MRKLQGLSILPQSFSRRAVESQKELFDVTVLGIVYGTIPKVFPELLHMPCIQHMEGRHMYGVLL